jgi:hypothetical protein
VIELARSGTRVSQLSSSTFWMTDATIYNWRKRDRIDCGEEAGQTTLRVFTTRRLVAVCDEARLAGVFDRRASGVRLDVLGGAGRVVLRVERLARGCTVVRDEPPPITVAGVREAAVTIPVLVASPDERRVCPAVLDE